MFVTFVRTGPILAKIGNVKNDLYLIWNISKTERAGKKIIKYDIYCDSHLPSDGTTVNIVDRDLDLYFQGQTFLAMHLQ